MVTAAHRRWSVVGLACLALGTALPWFTVGPASQLGVRTSGRWVLLLAVVAAVAAVADRSVDRVRSARAIAICATIGATVALVRLFVTPESTGPGVGSVVCVLGGVIAVLSVRGSLTAPKPAGEGV